jgi:hypothetical protein
VCDTESAGTISPSDRNVQEPYVKGDQAQDRRGQGVLPDGLYLSEPITVPRIVQTYFSTVVGGQVCCRAVVDVDEVGAP